LKKKLKVVVVVAVTGACYTLLTGARVSSAGSKSSGKTVPCRHSTIPSSDDPHHQHQGGNTYHY